MVRIIEGGGAHATEYQEKISGEGGGVDDGALGALRPTKVKTIHERTDE